MLGIYRFFFCFTVLFHFPGSVSFFFPHPAAIHRVYSRLKTHPVSCKLLDSPSLPCSHSISFPFLSVSLLLPYPPECLDRSKWCDCDCSVGRLPLHVCLLVSLESLTWAEGREKTERRRGESSFEQQAMASLQRAKSSIRSSSQLRPVPVFSISGLLWSLSFSHSPTQSFLGCVFPLEHPIFSLLSTISHFYLKGPCLFLLNLAHSTLTWSFLSWPTGEGVGCWCSGEAKPPNLGLSFTQKVSHCIWGASWQCRMSWHSKGRGWRMWVIWSRATKVCCLPMNGAFSHWHGEKRVNKHQCLRAALKCSAIFFSLPHLYKPSII